jgi:hypothetical protein
MSSQVLKTSTKAPWGGRIRTYFIRRRYIKFVEAGRRHLARQFTTALEQDPLSADAKEYRVTRSIDGKSFTTIAFIKR